MDAQRHGKSMIQKALLSLAQKKQVIVPISSSLSSGILLFQVIFSIVTK
jgi:hypothetical protein